jgi:NADH pyrophosphatase NudC (nudix superfamily)
MELDPNIAFFAIVTMGVGYAMALAGVHKSALEWRRRDRICPSCGHAIKARVCKCVSGASS